jgi:GH18 family chitinase
VIYFAVAPGTEGEFVAPEDWLEGFHKVLARLKPDQELFITIGGGSEAKNNAMKGIGIDLNKRARFLGEMEKFLKNNRIYDRIDGIDLDWEGKTADDSVKMLLEDIRAKFPGKLLTASISQRYHEKAAMAIPVLDQVHMMCYTAYALDDNGVMGQAPMTLYIKASTNYINAGVPPEKLVMGVPFYGRRPGERDARSYRRIVEAKPDIATGVNLYVENGKDYMFNGYDLIYAKTVYAIEHGFGGMMIWEMGHDILYSNPKSLTRAIVTAIQDSQKN